ncbi:type II toxin-antitoxin system VapB family antitoxin [Brevundimonas sp.]|uniref:type II toxin-antitoxin system VapB family antitoxin n=1 Tax=Brevundimonas sp. TaxID=1871086 RepID=UPI00286C9F5F|nr:type II toxin-antitoxin system VapB family antitoxin [Brevundimonas sp.]
MLNIKNPRAHELAVEVAQATGESLTDAVIHSLEERRDRLKPVPGELDLERIQELLAEIRPRLSESFIKETDPTADLYDPETGAPV